jgi:ArsR family transcriptional regulator
MSDILTLTKAMADETRIRLAAVLLKHELAVGEIVQALGLRQSRISRHLKILANSGLVSARRDGQWVFYSAAVNGLGREYLDLLSPLMSRDNVLAVDVAAAGRVVENRAKASARFFDEIAGDWEAMRNEILGDLDLVAEMAARVPTVVGAADLGCGTGRLLQVLADRADRIIGVDNARRMLDRARRYLDDVLGDERPVSLRIGDLEHLPLRDGEVGCAVMCLALHHLSSPLKGIREAFRVLSPGGRFLLADFEKHRDETMRTRLGDRWLGFTPAELDAWFESAGFFVTEKISFPLASGLVLRLMDGEKPTTGG